MHGGRDASTTPSKRKVTSTDVTIVEQNQQAEGAMESTNDASNED
jgi:hypothetical protein